MDQVDDAPVHVEVDDPKIQALSSLDKSKEPDAGDGHDKAPGIEYIHEMPTIEWEPTDTVPLGEGLPI